MEQLLKEIKNCRVCEPHLAAGCRPVLTGHEQSRVLVIGQAPGRIVHETGIPWNDKSGDNLRQWLGIDIETFYDTRKIAIVPMGFCYPGTGKTGDLAPRKECAPLWHEQLLEKMPNIELTLLIGAYAQKYYLGKQKKRNLTETVLAFREYLPQYLPLPHPSPRNNIWQKKNPWFKGELLPQMKELVQSFF